MGSPMSGLYVYPAVVTGAVLALVTWIWRRYDFLPSRQIEIVFFFWRINLLDTDDDRPV
jgi:hypothetical protein